MDYFWVSNVKHVQSKQDNLRQDQFILSILNSKDVHQILPTLHNTYTRIHSTLISTWRRKILFLPNRDNFSGGRTRRQVGESLRIDRSGAAPLLADEFLAGVYWLAKALSPSLWKERRPARWLFPLKNISPPCHHSHRGVELIIEQTAWYLTYVHRLFPSAEREDRAAPRPPRRFARENSHEEEIYNSRAFLRDNTCNLQLIIG